jgi:hypothetical protein
LHSAEAETAAAAAPSQQLIAQRRFDSPLAVVVHSLDCFYPFPSRQHAETAQLTPPGHVQQVQLAADAVAVAAAPVFAPARVHQSVCQAARSPARQTMHAGLAYAQTLA